MSTVTLGVCYLVLLVKSAELLQLQPIPVVVFVGEDLQSLECQIRDKEAIWSTEETLISFGEDLLIQDKRYSIDSSGDGHRNLEIRQLKLSEGGIYTCKDTGGTVLSKYNVIARSKAQIDYSTPSPVYTVEGDPAMLSCNASGLPQPRVSWYMANDKSNRDTWTDIKIRGPILRIYNITRECQGSYACDADNGLGNPATAIFEIFVIFPPEIKIYSIVGTNKHSGNKITVSQDQKLTLQCHVTSSPPASITWKINQSELATYNPESEQIIRNTENINKFSNILDFRIESVRKDVKYIMEMTLFSYYGKSSYVNYHCSATNSVGTTSLQITLRRE